MNQNLIILTLKDGTLEIRLEIPGNNDINVKHYVEGDETKIKVNGIKKKDKEIQNLDKIIFNAREFSNFEVIISLPVEKNKITAEEPKEGYPKLKNGVCIIQYELASKAKEVSIAADEL